jgi:DnaJ like chaperone protein
MKYLGKIIGAILGYWLTRHPLGIAVGLALGHAWDEGLLKEFLPQRPAKAALVDPLFALAGAVAKADGRVSEREIAAVEALMQRMDLDPSKRERAIAQFNAGKAAAFDLGRAGRELRAFCGFNGELKLVMLDVLADVAVADGGLSQAAEGVLERIARALDTTRDDFLSILARKRGAGGTRADPYQVLGVNERATDAEIRDAYRRLIAQHHPDKQSTGASDAERLVAEERSREINAAYERIKTQRGIK